MEKNKETITLTSAEAAKMLRKLTDEQNALLTKEANSCTFLASVGEDPETVRPEYDYRATQEKLIALEDKIRNLKHALNVFNTNTAIPEFDMTVDQMLVFIPQLTKRKAKLNEMRSRLKKMRAEQKYGLRQPTYIDYSYANYDIEEADDDCTAVSLLLSQAQLALDRVNNTVEFEVNM